MGKAEYNTENSTPFTVAEMLSLFKNHETVTFVLPGLGMTEAETVLFNDAIAELERLAEIGRATEKFFNSESYRKSMALEYGTYGSVIAFGIEELLEWAENNTEDDSPMQGLLDAFENAR